MKDGAYDLIEKPFEDAALFAIVQAALAAPDAGEATVPAGDGRTRSEIARAAALIARLSPREREVLDLAMQGKASKAIAHELVISPRTMEAHRLRLQARPASGAWLRRYASASLQTWPPPRGDPPTAV